MCAGGVARITFGRSGRSRWVPIMETERFRVEDQDATPERIKAISGAISIFYGNEEGVHPPSLDDLVPLYMQSIPAKRHVTYDPLTGKVEIRGKK